MTLEQGSILLLLGAGVGLVAMVVRQRRTAASESKRAQHELAVTQAAGENYHQKLRALSESSGAGIIMLDDRGTVVHANATADRYLGAEPEAMIGHALIQATLSRDLQEFVQRAATHATQLVADFPMQGSLPRIVRASAYPFAKGLSGAAETMLVLVDVTELRRLETIRRDFVANVSHELRTPLASIRAMAETLEDGALSDPEVSHKFLGTIIREADRLARISEDLLILSDAESKEPVREPMDLTPLLKDVVTRSIPHAQERGIALELAVEGALRLDGSKDQLEQVFVNLVDNAIKYTPSGGRVDVSAAREADMVRVDVKDTGIGIMDEHLSRLFERFYRVDKARSRESGGTGLGLSIVKNIVEAHGGEVGVSSVFNHGSTFTITLPSAEEL